MLQRTKGRILLALLVVTGMAGTPRNSTITQEERRFCVTNLKKSKKELLTSLKELSPAQLRFRPDGKKYGIEEYIFHMAAMEKALSLELQHAMKKPRLTGDDIQLTYTDEEIQRMFTKSSQPLLKAEAGANWTSVSDALNDFAVTRSETLKYVRTTTENLRNHVVQLECGTFDCYQLLLIMTYYSNQHIDQIREIMSSEGFPGS